MTWREKMNKKMFFKVMILTLIMVISATLMISCKPEEEAILQKYAIPEDLDVSIAVYSEKDAEANLLGTINKDTLLAITQQNVSMTTIKNEVETTKVYVGYSVGELLTQLEVNLPSFRGVTAIASDEWESDYEMSSFENSYITIGFEESDAFVADFDEEDGILAPRFISDKTSTSSRSVAKMVEKIILIPSQKYPIPENVDVNIAIYEGSVLEDNLLGTVTNEILTALKVRQQIVSMTTIKNDVETTTMYVAYSMDEIITELDFDLPETITSVKAIGSDDYKRDFPITSFEKSYVTIGFEDAGVFGDDFDEEDQVVEAPRFISDFTSTSKNSVAKMVVTIIINPIA
jgi:hypothetical protein